MYVLGKIIQIYRWREFMNHMDARLAAGIPGDIREFISVLLTHISRKRRRLSLSLRFIQSIIYRFRRILFNVTLEYFTSRCLRSIIMQRRDARLFSKKKKEKKMRGRERNISSYAKWRITQLISIIFLLL